MAPQRKFRNPEELKQYLFTKRTVTETGCWEWNGARHTFGYGLLRAGKTSGTRLAMVGVHRLSAQLWLNLPPESKLSVLHRCDNPPCFNPEHLMIGTQADNIQDAIKKGRPHPAYLGSQRTHCKYGHERIPENVYDRGNGRRACKICAKIAAKRNYKYQRKTA